MTASPPVTVLPEPVRRLAERLGATGDMGLAGVELGQAGSLRGAPDGRSMRFSASQVIRLRRPAFTWRARMGPFGCLSVVDALEEGIAQLDLRLFGAFRLAHETGGPALAKGEAMRYLAELAWAPDAILLNPALDWHMVDERTLRVGTGEGAGRGEVTLRLDEEGRIFGASAEDRPRKEAAGFVARRWRGRFLDYRWHQDRWIPFGGEADWILDGCAFTTWRGSLLRWGLA